MSGASPGASEPAGGTGSGPRRWRPYPFEIAAWASLAAAVLFLRANGPRIDWNTVVYTVPPLFRPTAQVLLSPKLSSALSIPCRSSCGSIRSSA